MEDGAPDKGERSKPLNLNILPVLRELLRAKNVTRAATTLNMSQSAVSDALSRLRTIFQDDLLVAEGRGFVLSERAKALEPLVSGSLSQLEMLLNARAFDPSEASGRIQIAATDNATLAIGPQLVRRLNEAAPGVCVQFHDANDDSIDALANGQLDFILISEAFLSAADLHLERVFLFEDELTLIASADADMEDGSGNEKDWGAPNTFFYPLTDRLSLVRPAIRQHFGEEEMETIVLPAFILLPFFVENTNITAIVQRRLAERLQPAAGIKIVSPPFPFSKVRMFAAWNKSRTNDPLHIWLRELMVEIGAELTGENSHLN